MKGKEKEQGTRGEGREARKEKERTQIVNGQSVVPEGL